MTPQYIESEGKTKEDALENALNELGVNREQVSVTVLNEPTKGILGLGAKLAKVRVTVKEDLTTPENILRKMLDLMGIEGEINSQMVNGRLHLDIDSDSPGLIIGRHGRTLNALQYLLNSILHKNSLVKKRVIVDTENYRQRHENRLAELAQIIGDKVKRTGRNFVMDPMPPQDRRIIHITLESDSELRTFSRGDGDMRRVVIVSRRND